MLYVLHDLEVCPPLQSKGYCQTIMLSQGSTQTTKYLIWVGKHNLLINCNKSAYISIIKKYYGDQIFSGYGIREGGRGKLNTAA